MSDTQPAADPITYRDDVKRCPICGATHGGRFDLCAACERSK